MNRIVHFEIGAGDFEKSKKFYEDIFGWKYELYEGKEPYYLIKTGDKSTPGINGGMFKSKGEPLSVNTIEVNNIDEMMAKVESNGGTIAVRKMPIPGLGWLCYCKDSESILFGLYQDDKNAK
ncbi:MAG TPA: VOC family protein [Ignavibacteria bacterium]|nr:VOC family protein [Ignavibacteria bacterium]